MWFYPVNMAFATEHPVLAHSEYRPVEAMVRTGEAVEVDDVDELLAAVRHGLLSPDVGEEAVRTALSTVEGLSRNGYDLDRWLAGNGLELTWRGA
ncbi:hypothetical protein A5651_04950 [Mycobacterium sp. 1274761.0]|nr:hypothetical protein A5651_04950 [Mycobacterium sp. 1274761.0]